MFKNISANMTHHFKEEDKDFIDQKIADLKLTAKKVGITLAIAVPAAILLAVTAHVAGEIAIDKLTNK